MSLALIAVIAASVLLWPAPGSRRARMLREGSLRHAGELGGMWFRDGEIDRELTSELCELALHDKDRLMRRKCLVVLNFAKVRFPQECDTVAKKLLLDEDPGIVTDAIRVLADPLTPEHGQLLLGIWRAEVPILHESIAIAFERFPDRLTWYARLLRTKDISDPFIREIVWKKLRAVGCDLKYDVHGPNEASEWKAVVEWLRERTPGEWE